MILYICFLTLGLLFLIFGKAVSDRVNHIDLWSESIFSKFDKSSFWGCKDYSWIRKDHPNKILNWLLHNPLVFLTDIWHLANSMQRLGIYFSMVGCWFASNLSAFEFFIYLIPAFILTNILGFHITYHYILKKRKK